MSGRRLRAFIALAAIAALFAFLAAPSLYALVAWNRLSGADARSRRRRVGRWQECWGEAFLAIISRVMGISIAFDLPSMRLPKGPYIVVSNHVGGFDGFLIVRLLRLLRGRADFRAIGKKALASWPVVGLLWRELGWGFVARSGDPNDYRVVERCGAAAFADGEGILIFPEGTTYDPAKLRDGYRFVLPPKNGGLNVLRRAMPECPLISVTISWDKESYGVSLLEGSIPFGRRVRVEASFLLAEGDAHLDAWLRNEWRRKDAAIAQN